MRASPLRAGAMMIVLSALVIAGCGGVGGLHTVPLQSTGGPQKLKTMSAGGRSKAVWGAPLTGGAPKALIILIHGGGWTGINPVAFEDTLRESVIFRGIGFETLTVDYRAGAQGVKDVAYFYQQARKQVGGRIPICAFGTSAGGHIALMLAARFSDLSCVIDLAGPTDLPALSSDPGGSAAYRIATQRFGTSDLASLSPALRAKSIKAKLLLVYAQNDPLVPVAQGHHMKAADPSAQLIVLPPGNSPFVHTGVGAPIQDTEVNQQAKAAAQQAEAQLLTSVSQGQA